MQNKLPLRLATLLAALGLAHTLPAQISYTTGTYTQNFDSLPTASVTGVFSNTIGTQAAIPAPTTASPLLGWSGVKVGGTGTAATAFTADTGALSSGFIYSYGAASSSDRALGALASGSNVMAFGAEFVNNTGGTITSLTIAFTAEFWRSSTSAQNVLAFAYGVGGGTITSSNYLSSAAMTAATSLNVVGPAPVATNGALDGNLPANQAAVTATLTGLSIPNGTSFFIRWTDTNDAGNDAGLAIDNFSLSATFSTGANIPVGSTNALFTPTSFGGNAFTAQDTAVFDAVASAAGTVSLQGNVLATALSFTANGYTLANSSASDSISLTGAIGVATDKAATVSATMAGSSGLSKIGAGTLTLSGVNTFSGPVTINTGVLSIAADSALGAASNGVVVNGTLSSSVPSLSLGSGRTLSGSGSIVTPAGGTVSLAGPLNGGSLAFTGLSTLNLAGATNAVTNLTFDGPATVNVTGGALQLAGGITTAGNTSVVGAVGLTAGTKTLATPSGSFAVNGTLTLGGGRIQKTGPGAFDLTGTTVAGTGGLQLGALGNDAAMREGGTVTVNEAGDLGTVQMFFNSGTLSATAPISAPISVSIGGRADLNGASLISVPTFAGSNMTFTGADSSYFFYSASVSATYDRVAFNVNNTTRFDTTFAKTGTSTTAASAVRVFILVGGTGKLVFGGNASAIVDDFDLNDSVTLSIASTGQLGGRRIFVDSGTTLEGAGSFIGQANDSIDPGVIVASGGTINPTGILVLNSSLTLGGDTILDIAGPTAGTQYDRLSLTNTAGTSSYTLTYGGALKLNFPATAQNGDYTLFATGTGLSRSGSFASVVLTGSHSGSLSQSGTDWSGTVGDKTFSFSESTGVLTVSGGLSAIDAWRLANFGATGNTGNGADSADFDGDGIQNLLEYATGTNPTAANASAVTLSRSGDFLTLAFPRIGDASLTYTVQASNDLTSGFATATGSVNTANNVSTYTDNVSLATPGVRRFLRLQVSYGQ